MIKTLPLHLRINLRGKLAASGLQYALDNTVKVQAACDTFWRYYGIPLGLWLANPYRSTQWRKTRAARINHK
jgi:hypothetical protein